MNRNNIIFAIGGAVIGALGGFFAAKAHYQKFYEQQANETVEAMKELLYKTAPDEEEYDEEEESVNPVTKWTDEKAAEVREKLERNHRAINYAAMYGQVKKEDKYDENSDETSSEDTEDQDADDSEDEDPEIEALIARHEKSKGRRPYLISMEKARDLPAGIDIVDLQFYDEDKVLADADTEERISNVDLVVGDCLRKYGFMDSDEPVVYVMNDELDTCYEVVRVDASYEETHPE